MSSCFSCGSTDIEASDVTGESFCRACGTIVALNNFVDTVTFHNSGGGAQASGRMIQNGFGVSVSTRNSREMVLSRANETIGSIASALNIPNRVEDGARRMFSLALNQRLTIGRRREYVATACLYATCRRDKLPVMLMDFSDLLEVPVKVLGQIFMKLCRVLRVRITSIDPGLFMERFASKVEKLQGVEREVSNTASQLVQHMDRDWISAGRRPHGIIGSALILASRLHDIHVSVEDISHLVRISPSTLNNRMLEFKKTATAKLSLEDIQTTDVSAIEGVELPWRSKVIMRRQSRLALGLPPRKRKYRPLKDRAEGGNSEIALMINDAIEALALSSREITSEERAQEFSELPDIHEEKAVKKGVKEDFTELGIEMMAQGDIAGDRLDDIFDIIGGAKPVRGTPSTQADTQNTLSLMDDMDLGTQPGTQTQTQKSQILGDPEGCVDDFLSLLMGEPSPVSKHPQVSLMDVNKTRNVYETGDGDEEESDLESVDSDDFQSYILDKQQCRAKTLVWDDMTRDIMPGLLSRRAERLRNASRIDAKATVVKEVNVDTFVETLSKDQRNMYQDIFSFQ